MTVNRHKYFRWTKRTAWITFAYVALVPGLMAAAGYKYEVSWRMFDSGCGHVLITGQGKWDYRGKRRGDLLSEF